MAAWRADVAGDGFADEVADDKVRVGGHGGGMRWVLMLFVVLAAVMGGEVGAVVVMGRVAVSERVGRAEVVEESAEASRIESERAFVEDEATGLVDGGPSACWFPGGAAVARSDCGAGQGWARPIEEVGLGDRVLTVEAGGAQESGTAVMDPAPWRAYSLRVTRADGTVTRGAWIGAGELVPGEALAAWRGEPVAVLAVLLGSSCTTLARR